MPLCHSKKKLNDRTFPFHSHPALKAMLERRRMTATAIEQQYGIQVPWVFWRAKGEGRIAPVKSIDTGFRSVVKAAGIVGKKITPHSLRHTVATNLLLAGVPVNVAVTVTGHADANVYLNTYARHVDQSAQALAVAKQYAAQQDVFESLSK